MPNGVEQQQMVSQAKIDPNQGVTQVSLFKADGTPFGTLPAQAAAQIAFVGVDITALKVELNAFLVKLRNAGIIAP